MYQNEIPVGDSPYYSTWGVKEKASQSRCFYICPGCVLWFTHVSGTSRAGTSHKTNHTDKSRLNSGAKLYIFFHISKYVKDYLLSNHYKYIIWLWNLNIIDDQIYGRFPKIDVSPIKQRQLPSIFHQSFYTRIKLKIILMIRFAIDSRRLTF